MPGKGYFKGGCNMIACAKSGKTCSSATSDITCADGFAFNGVKSLLC